MLHDDDDDDLVPCPYCKAPIYEDSQRCPECGNYISEEDAPPWVKPLWIVGGAVAALAGIVYWIWRGI